MATEDLDPFGNYYFSLEIENTEVAHFMEFSGLKTSAEVFEIQEGGLNGAVHKMPGQSKYENLTLKYATSASQALAEWRDTYLRDDYSSRTNSSGAIVMRDNSGKEIRRYSFLEIWPVAWEGPSLASSGSAIAVESLEVAYDGLYIDGGDPPEPPPEPEPEPEPDPDEPLATEPIPFHFDSDKMKPEGEAACERVAKSINSQDPPPPVVYIEGHTCTMGSFSYNLSLSKRRAAATKAKMSEKCPDTTFHSEGFSWKYPTASNATEAGRVQNRRTEFYETSYQERGRDTSDPGGKPG